MQIVFLFASKKFLNLDLFSRISEKIIKNTGYQVIEMAQFRPGANYAIFKNPGNQNPAVYKISEITID